VRGVCEGDGNVTLKYLIMADDFKLRMMIHRGEFDSGYSKRPV
jgi:hypothetical protein